MNKKSVCSATLGWEMMMAQKWGRFPRSHGLLSLAAMVAAIVGIRILSGIRCK
jgi:hypothetical protein